MPAGRFKAHLGHAGQPVQQRLVHHHVVDAGERDVAPAAFQQAAADRHAVTADAVTIGEVAQHRDGHQDGDHDAGRQVIGRVAAAIAAAEQNQRRQRDQELADLLQQHEQPRQRVQPLFVIG